LSSTALDMRAARFSMAAFTAPPRGQRGNFGRNVLRGFGAWKGDIAIQRQFRLTEKLNLCFRSEFFNIFQPSELRPSRQRFDRRSARPFNTTHCQQPRLRPREWRFQSAVSDWRTALRPARLLVGSTTYKVIRPPLIHNPCTIEAMTVNRNWVRFAKHLGSPGSHSNVLHRLLGVRKLCCKLLIHIPALCSPCADIILYAPVLFIWLWLLNGLNRKHRHERVLAFSPGF
jgi:hypothetical protein